MKKLPRKVWSVAFTRSRKDQAPHLFSLEGCDGGQERYSEYNEKGRLVDWFYPDSFQDHFNHNHEYVRFWSPRKSEVEAFLAGFDSVKKLVGKLFKC